MEVFGGFIALLEWGEVWKVGRYAELLMIGNRNRGVSNE